MKKTGRQLLREAKAGFYSPENRGLFGLRGLIQDYLGIVPSGYLSAQHIEALCKGPQPMIVGFQSDKLIREGYSGGLSSCSYDVHLQQDLLLGVHPGVLLKRLLSDYTGNNMEYLFSVFQERLQGYPPHFGLFSTIETYNIPTDIGVAVKDKSSGAREARSAYNTHFDPNFCGGGTLEIVNDGFAEIELPAGTPVCQMLFFWLDEETHRPYNGKYQNQSSDPTPVILEGVNTHTRPNDVRIYGKWIDINGQTHNYR